MLAYAYVTPDHLPFRDDMPDRDFGSESNVRFCIALYRVADKYDFSSASLDVQLEFQYQLRRWLCGPREDAASREAVATPDKFHGIVSEVYELPNASPKHPMVNALLCLRDFDRRFKLLGNNGEKPMFLIEAAAAVPEFGRDVLLRALDETGRSKPDGNGMHTVTELVLASQVCCPHCRRIWSRSHVQPAGAACAGCGEWVADWTLHDEIPVR